ncbi:MAG: ABC transporter permease [Microgenomates group bacterium]|nr:ABC transporter permease [Microgenomates group bacterium]
MVRLLVMNKNYFLFIIKNAFSDLLKNKLRAFLTTLGIVIGVSSVVLLLAFGLGLKQYIADQFNNLGTNLVFVLPGQVFNRSGGFSSIRSSMTFEEKDFQNLKKAKKAIDVVPIFQKTTLVKALGKEQAATLYGTSDEIFAVRNLIPKYGEVFKKTDLEKKSKVVVMGPEIAEKIFDNQELAVNQKIRIEDQTFKVIGVLESKGGGGLGGPNLDTFLYIPYKTIFNITGKKNFTTFLLKAESEKDIEDLKKEAKEIMLKRYKEDDFSVADSKEIISTIQSIFSVLNMVLVGIGAVSLIVGGVGIMNIMYVSVTERTREIGIRRALGALEKDILFQFLFESILLSLIGGIIGLAISCLIVYFVRFFFPALIDIKSVFLAIFVSSAIGIFFGIFPARKAARLSPIEAIRYE